MKQIAQILWISLLASATAFAQTEVFTAPPSELSAPSQQVVGVAGYEAEWKVAIDVRRLAAHKTARS